jgi:MFS family permease
MNEKFTTTEKKLITGMSMLMGIRMLGVSMIIPVFSIIATSIPGSDETLAGIAVGIYGLSQTLFLVPMGRLSDLWGRKQATLLGLAVYITGTLLSGISSNIYYLIISRFIAGAGAVSGITMAWLTDGIGSGRRNSALSYVGMSIGFSVIAGFTFSPVIAGLWEPAMLFYVCAALTFAAFLFTAFILKNAEEVFDSEQALTLEEEKGLAAILSVPDMRRICLSALSTNVILTSAFFIMPVLLSRESGITSMWKLYVIMSAVGTLLMFRFARKADSSGTVRVAMAAFLIMLAGLMTASASTGTLQLSAAFILIYSGHCILSPVYPAAVSRYPGRMKGAVQSLLNASQFTGSGIGGVLSGVLLKTAPELFFPVISLFMIIPFYSMYRFRNFE